MIPSEKDIKEICSVHPYRVCINPSCTYTGKDFNTVKSLNGLEYQCPKCNWIIQSESVKSQKHYTQFKIQPIEFIHANSLNYSQGNVIKYVCRYKEKDGIKDLEKAKVYIDYLIQELKTGTVKP